MVHNIASLNTVTTKIKAVNRLIVKLSKRDKLFKSFKPSCFKMNLETYKEGKTEVQRAIKHKNKYFTEKLA